MRLIQRTSNAISAYRTFQKTDGRRGWCDVNHSQSAVCVETALAVWLAQT